MAVYEWGQSRYDQAAIKKVNDNLTKIAELYKECAQIADEQGFTFSYDGPAGYGDSGDYNGEEGWQASSTSC